ncbi:hypothetical protein OGY01_05075 [Citrobacter sp. Cm038]|uniref:hypothetical protein n=1 Tax=Citrobacter sp. Cm038 TaxID=2985117 RepID=UPI0025779577|nr:hypothetical protein [Citrobacter sp. Cm038]MDM2941814.1 hypothetical protein [Citrobacter sp. Cm038]
MTATNKPMTGAQLDELMAVAMRMQSDSEKMGDRSVSMFAYAVQVAVLEIRETRCKYGDLQSQNADLAVQLANAESKCRDLAAENAGLMAAGNKMFLSAISLMEDPELKIDHARDIKDWEKIKTPATDAFLAEVRASTLDEFAKAQDEQAKKYYEISPGCSGQNECQFAAGQAWYYAECIRKGAAL